MIWGFILTGAKVYHMIQDNNARDTALLENFSDRKYKNNRGTMEVYG